MKALFPILAIVVGAMFAYAPVMIAAAPYESTMGLVQKIFYFHMPPAMLMLLSAVFCGLVSAAYLIKKRPVYDWIAYAAAELTVLYGASDEWHQMYVPMRTAELHDLIADAIGAFAAGISLKAWVIIRRL